MASRYATRGGWVPWIEPDEHDRKAESFEPDLYVPEAREPVSTGLYDSSGRELFRLPEPIGFHNPKD